MQQISFARDAKIDDGSDNDIRKYLYDGFRPDTDLPELGVKAK